ncbi:MAG: pseudouridine synthase [Terriglobales bacterium]
MIRTFRPAAEAAPSKPPRRDKPEMTLDRVLSRAGLASRTVAAGWIAAGRVQVDGRTLDDAQAWVVPARQRILLDGAPLQPVRRLYWALHKPVGVITSHGDPQRRPTIYDVVGKRASWYFPVGRLDQDTSGLLLLTNDSTFAEQVANPAVKVEKIYQARTEAGLSDAEVERLRQGLDIGRGERSAPARAHRLRRAPAGTWVELVLREGKNRQVRRMFEALGHQVIALERVQIGKLKLGDLAAGAVRAIRPSDVL